MTTTDLFFDKGITSEAIPNIRDYTLREPNTLIVAPRRSGKTSFLIRQAEMENAHGTWPATIVVANHAMRKIAKHKLAHNSLIECVLVNDAWKSRGPIYIDEIAWTWKAYRDPNPELPQFPWNRVVCATASELDFDKIQCACIQENIMPEYDWIKHIVIQLPGLQC